MHLAAVELEPGLLVLLLSSPSRSGSHGAQALLLMDEDAPRRLFSVVRLAGRREYGCARSSVRLIDKLRPKFGAAHRKVVLCVYIDRATAACDLEVQFVLCSIPASFPSLRGNRAVRCSLYTSRQEDIWPERCSLAQRSGGLKGRITGTGTA